MVVRIIVPEANMGDVGRSEHSPGARPGDGYRARRSIVTAQVPLAEMQRYTTDLRSITGGRGVFEMDFSHYEVVPTHIAQDVINLRQKEVAAARED
jgi:elongation factor G